jgi:Arc/MetJ family transcription regulator
MSRAATSSSASLAKTAVPRVPRALGSVDDPLLAEALRLAESTRNTVEDALVAFGRWLLVHVFDDDAAAALANDTPNPLWTELLRRCGGPTLRLSRRFLHVAVAIAAHDKRINDDAWRLLEPGRKELLLPLADEKVMRKAAAHVVKLKLSQRSTRKYVKTLRESAGSGPETRLTPERAHADVSRFLSRVTDAGYEQKLSRAVKKMDAGQRKALAGQAAELRAFATRLAKLARTGD